MTSPSISVITVCMNRLEHLRAAASRVAQWEHHFEHIVVDWCSQRPIERDHLPSDPRLRLVRVDGVADWHPGQAYNFAASCAQGEWLFRLDADCWVQNLDPTSLIHQSEIPAWVANASQEGSLGEILVPAEKFWGIGGYSELMRGYGFEDKDFVYRLEAAHHASCGSLAAEQVHFIPHGPQLRAVVRDSDAVARAFKRSSSAYNRFVAASVPWTARRRRASYRQLGADHWLWEMGTLPELPASIAEEARRIRRSTFWGHFLMLPEQYVIHAPQVLLPSDQSGRFHVRWFHRLYWHTVRRLIALPLDLLSVVRRLRG